MKKNTKKIIFLNIIFAIILVGTTILNNIDIHFESNDFIKYEAIEYTSVEIAATCTDITVRDGKYSCPVNESTVCPCDKGHKRYLIGVGQFEMYACFVDQQAYNKYNSDNNLCRDTTVRDGKYSCPVNESTVCPCNKGHKRYLVTNGQFETYACFVNEQEYNKYNNNNECNDVTVRDGKYSCLVSESTVCPCNKGHKRYLVENGRFKMYGCFTDQESANKYIKIENQPTKEIACKPGGSIYNKYVLAETETELTHSVCLAHQYEASRIKIGNYYYCIVTKESKDAFKSECEETIIKESGANDTTSSGKHTSGAQSGASGDFAKFWEYAFNFFKPGIDKEENPTITNMINTMLDVVIPLAAVLFAALIIVQGVKYIFAATADKKTSAKEGLVGIVISGILIFGGVQLYNTISDLLTIGSNITDTTSAVFGMLIAVVQVIAFAGIIFVGLKYMKSSASEKSNFKSSLPILIIGVVLVFGAPFVYNLIKLISEMLTQR